MKSFVFFIMFVLTWSVAFSQKYEKASPQIMGQSIYETEKASLAWFEPNQFKVVGKNDKMELGVDLSESIKNKINDFFEQAESTEKINPFNRHQLDITANFYLNNILVNSVDAFYYEEFKREQARNRWVKDKTDCFMRIRTSLPEIGNYRLVVTVDVRGQKIHSFEDFITVVESTNNGYIELGTHGRSFRFSDNKRSFYGIGQEIPWAETSDFSKSDQSTTLLKFIEFEDALKAFHKSQGNYTRFVPNPWFMLLEWESLGNYQPKMAHAWEFDRVDQYCRENGIYYIYSLLFHVPLEPRSDAEEINLPGVRWEAYCYNDKDLTVNNIAREPKIGIDKAEEFFSNKTAIDHQRNYFRYVVSRWGFSNSVACWQLMNEVDNTAHYRDYYNEKGELVDRKAARDEVTKWTKEQIDYLSNDLNDKHMKSISLINGENSSTNLWDPEIWNHKDINVVGFHNYSFDEEKDGGEVRNRNIRVRYRSVNNIGLGLQKEKNYPSFAQKAFVFDENGHCNVIPHKWPEDKDVDPSVLFNNCAGFMYKQDLWFTFSSGCAVAGLDWWSDLEDERQKDWVRYHPGLVSFSNRINYEKVNYTEVKEYKGDKYISQRWPFEDSKLSRSNEKEYRKDDIFESYVQLSSDQNQGFGWVLNRSYNWMNLIDSLDCLKDMFEGNKPYSKRYLYSPKDDDVTAKPLNINRGEAYFKIFNANKRTKYIIEYYNTESGERIAREVIKSNWRGELKVEPIDMLYFENYDLAFLFYELGSVWIK